MITSTLEHKVTFCLSKDILQKVFLTPKIPMLRQWELPKLKSIGIALPLAES